MMQTHSIKLPAAGVLLLHRCRCITSCSREKHSAAALMLLSAMTGAAECWQRTDCSCLLTQQASIRRGLIHHLTDHCVKFRPELNVMVLHHSWRSRYSTIKPVHAGGCAVSTAVSHSSALLRYKLRLYDTRINNTRCDMDADVCQVGRAPPTGWLARHEVSLLKTRASPGSDELQHVLKVCFNSSRQGPPLDTRELDGRSLTSSAKLHTSWLTLTHTSFT